MPDFDLTGELSLKIELHMLSPITEKVHSGNGPVSLVHHLHSWYFVISNMDGDPQIVIYQYAILFIWLKFQTALKQVNFAGNLISQILQKVQIREIKLLWNCKFFIDNNGKFSIFAKSSCHWIGNNFQFEKKKKKKLPAKLTCFTVSQMVPTHCS